MKTLTPAVFARFLLLAAAAAALALSPTPFAHAQPQGVSYTFTPVVDAIRWGEDAGLEDTELYGGRLGLSFGRMVSLQGFYFARNDVATEVAGIDPPLVGGAIADRELDLSNYGVDVTLSLGAGRAVPFLRGGGGVLRFHPAEGDDIRQINMKAGGGMRFGFRRFQAELFAEDTAFRVDRLQLVTPPPGGGSLADPDADRIRHNLSLGAGLTFFLGGASESHLSETDRAVLERYRQGLSGLSIPIEPFAGRLDFHDDLALENQYLFGARTGFDFGRLFGLRGYYWRGVTEEFDDTVPIQSWGGEARFNLNSGQGAVPYLVTGIGQIDFMRDFRDRRGESIEDKTVLILGGGLGFRLGDRFELDLSARDHILSGPSLEDTASPDDLTSNWMFAAGVRMSLGGSSAGGQRPLFGGAPAEAPAEIEEADESEMEEPAEPQEEEEIAESAQEGEEYAVEADAEAEVEAAERAEAALPEAPRAVTGYAGDRMIVIPVPTEGEIYIRYGTPGGVSIVSQTSSAQGATAPPATAAAEPAPAPPAAGQAVPQAPAPDVETLRSVIREELRRAGVARDGDRMPEEVRWVEKESNEGEPSAPRRIVFEEQPEEPGLEVVEEREEPARERRTGYRVYTGLNVDEPTQSVFGGRLDLGPVSRNSPFQLVPEAALGFGDGATTILGAANLVLPLGEVGAGRWMPYLSAGLGFLSVDVGDESETDLVLNFGFGVDAKREGWKPFFEYQAVKGFDLNRFLAGIRFGE